MTALGVRPRGQIVWIMAILTLHMPMGSSEAIWSAFIRLMEPGGAINRMTGGQLELRTDVRAGSGAVMAAHAEGLFGPGPAQLPAVRHMDAVTSGAGVGCGGIRGVMVVRWWPWGWRWWRGRPRDDRRLR